MKEIKNEKNNNGIKMPIIKNQVKNAHDSDSSDVFFIYLIFLKE